MKTNEQLKVIVNPHSAKGELPWVRFAAGNGWSVADTRIKGCHNPNLALAVADYNRTVTRYVEALNVERLEPFFADVMELPGWGDAVRDEILTRYGALPPIGSAGAFPLPPAVEGATEARVDSPQVQAEAFARLGSGKSFGALGALLFAAAMVGALPDFEDGLDDDETLEEPPSPEMREVLERSKILIRCPHGVATLAVPRDLGVAWSDRLVAGIKANDRALVEAMLIDAGLMK